MRTESAALRAAPSPVARQATSPNKMTSGKGPGPVPRTPEQFFEWVMEELKSDPETLQKRYGSKDSMFLQTIVLQLMELGIKNANTDSIAAAFGLAVIRSANPINATEAMLLTQMTAVHNAVMKLFERLNQEQEVEKIDVIARCLASMSRVYAEQFKALRSAHQEPSSVRVENVTVNDGGQAIVGQVDSKPRRREEQ